MIRVTHNKTYDVENRLKSATGRSSGYRPDNLRAWTGTASGAAKVYKLYDGGNCVYKWGSSSVSTAYAPDGLVASNDDQFLFDWQGNTAHIVGGSGPDGIHAAYNAWGQLNAVYPAPKSLVKFNYNARWGYVQDTTGLYYCQNRYYDRAQGRWLTRDPIGYAGGINLYGYCVGNPVLRVDVYGESVTVVTAAAGAIIGALIGAAFNPDDPWCGALMGGVAGGVAGLTLGLAAPLIPATAVGGAVGGGVSAVIGNAVGQGVGIWHGCRKNFDVAEACLAFAGGALGGAFLLRPQISPKGPISSWAGKNGPPPDLAEGRWVMQGNPSLRNKLMTGLGKNVGETTKQGATSPNGMLEYPPGWEAFKGLLGQRVIPRTTNTIGGGGVRH